MARYKIGEIARILNLESYVLRFWETEFPNLKPRRTAKGQRYYTDADLILLQTIKTLLYDQGLTIEGARKALQEQALAKGNHQDVLTQVARELKELQALLRS